MAREQQCIAEAKEPIKTEVTIPEPIEDVFSSEFRKRVVEQLQKEGKERKAEKFAECNERKLVTECEECGNPRAVPVGCGLRICPTCRIRQNNKLKEKYKDIVKNIYNPKLLTVTKKNVERLTKKHIQELRSDFNKLLRRKSTDGKKCIKEVNGKEVKKENYIGLGKKVRGGLYAIETKKTVENDNWNVHIHAIISSEYIPQEKLSKTWEDITGDSKIVDIRKVSGERGLDEVLNYVAKEGEIQEVEDLVRYEEVMSHCKQIQAFGTLYDKRPEEYHYECKECGCEKWKLLGMVKGAVIEYSKVELEYMAQVLTSLDTKKTSPRRNNANSPPNEDSKGFFEEIMEKKEKFLKRVRQTDDKNAIAEEFGEGYVDQMEKEGVVFCPRPGKIKVV